MIVRKTVIDERTGLCNTADHQYPDVLNNDGYLFWARKKQCRTFSDVELPECLTYTERGRLLNLTKHIELGTNCLVKRTNKGYTHMSDQDITKALGLEGRRGIALIRKLMTAGVIGKMVLECEGIITTQYFVNPIYFHAGKRLSKTLYRVFAKHLEQHLEKWVKDELGGE